MKQILFLLSIIICTGLFPVAESFCQQTNRAICSPCEFTEVPAEFCSLLVNHNACIGENLQVQGDLTVCGSTKVNNAQVFSYSTETQTIGVPAPTFADITFTNDPIISGWTHSLGDSQFICLQAGNYLIEYDAICRITDSQLTDISIIALQNGSEIAGSQGSTQQPVNNRPLSLTRSFIVAFSVDDILTLQFTGGTQSVQLEANSGNSSIGTPVNGVRPSITLTITKVS